MSDKPEGFYERVLFTLFALGAVILLLSMLLIVYDVIARNIGISPFEHTIALTEYGLYFMTLLSAPWLVRKKHHIYIQLLTGLVSDYIRPLLSRTSYFLCTLTCLFICYYAGLIAVENFIRGDYEVRSFDMARWIIFSVMSLSFFLLAIEFSRYLFGFDSMYSGELGIKE
jgi:C4-dicarboxylate transporter, DctQ subunit